MPINPNALSAPEPDEQPPSEAAAAAVSGQTNEHEDPAAEPPKRTRRKKSEMIADAVVPGMDDVVEIKDAGTGAKIERPWRVAVEMFRDGKATWLDKPQEYAFLKYEQQRASGAFGAHEDGGSVGDTVDDTPTERQPDSSAFSQDAAAAHSDTGEDPANPEPDPMPAPSVDNADEPQETHDASGQRKAPEGAELGDEVIIGASVYNVGHGHVLVQGVVAKDGEIILPKQRWQRELGPGPDGPWVATALAKASIDNPGASSNGKADGVKVETERLPREVEQVPGDGVLTWKIGNGILEKIGLPDYSSLQVGPITASRMVVDDGRRTTVSLGDNRVGQVPTAVIEAFEEVDNTVEYIAKRFRGQLQAFLEATGALKQPV